MKSRLNLVKNVSSALHSERPVAVTAEAASAVLSVSGGGETDAGISGTL